MIHDTLTALSALRWPLAFCGVMALGASWLLTTIAPSVPPDLFDVDLWDWEDDGLGGPDMDDMSAAAHFRTWEQEVRG